MTRRTLIAAPALIGLTAKADRRIEGGFVNDSFALGHTLRARTGLSAPRRTVKVPIVIVGGGIAGLSAAWQLDRRNFHDFVLLEMEHQPGGNARWGENEITAYPWAAHYVPVPNRNSTLVRELFTELGVMRDGHYDERYLCFSPQERLFIHGRWQEGIEPALESTARDREEMKRFDQRIREFRQSGQFTIPMELGAKPSPLDNLSMQHWLQQERFTSPYLHWYVNYACRDDYGALAANTSAWAGIHYFASRENEEKGPLVWPEGTGWIARRLAAKLQRYLQTGSMVQRIERAGANWRVLAGGVEYLARTVIFAAPTFLAQYIVEGFQPIPSFQYSPWLTANLTLDRMPRERNSEQAWDNTLYDSPALGYVVATHQTLSSHTEKTVWTYYWALAQGMPKVNRQLLLDKDWSYWKEAILSDLERPHADIRSCVRRIDIMHLGHAMIRPAPGFQGCPDRQRALSHGGNLYFANSDLSGLSLFEEAQFRGVQAANRALGGGR